MIEITLKKLLVLSTIGSCQVTINNGTKNYHKPYTSITTSLYGPPFTFVSCDQ